MRVFPFMLLGLTLMVSACGKNRHTRQTGAAHTGNPQTGQHLIVTPDNQVTGKIAQVAPGVRFVVITFPVGHPPAAQQQLNVYRGGLKVGEVRISGPWMDDNVVADIATGDVEVGDEVRGN